MGFVRIADPDPEQGAVPKRKIDEEQGTVPKRRNDGGTEPSLHLALRPEMFLKYYHRQHNVFS